MLKLLIVDDEPLIRYGIISLIDQNQFGGIEIETASNGQAALNKIKTVLPDIVLMDIKMPLMDGFQVLQAVDMTLPESPVFIMLTNYDDFESARNCFRFGALDYLIKIELNEEILNNSISKAVDVITQRRKVSDTLPSANILSATDDFFRKLFLGHYFSNSEINDSLQSLQIELKAPYYVVLYYSFITQGKPSSANEISDKAIAYIYSLLKSTFSSLEYSYVLPYTHSNFIVFLGLMEPTVSQEIFTLIKRTHSATKHYTNLASQTGISSVYSHIVDASKAFQESIVVFSDNVQYDEQENSIREFQESEKSRAMFYAESNLAFVEAINSENPEAVKDFIQQLTEQICQNTTSLTKAMDLASEFLYLLSFEKITIHSYLFNCIFKDNYPFYEIRQMKSKQDITEYISQLEKIICIELSKRKNFNKSYLIPKIQEYISDNISKKCSLKEISDVFHLTPNYISSQFKKFTGVGYSEYVTKEKINAAQKMLMQADAYAYDVAEKLGYDDPYYFSKLFKRVTGFSPKEYAFQYRQMKQDIS